MSIATLYSESLNNVNSESHIPNFSEVLCNARMQTNDEIRRENLEIAIKRLGSAAKLAEAASTSPTYLSQIRNRTPDSKTGTPKTMGDALTPGRRARGVRADTTLPQKFSASLHISLAHFSDSL